ncbi:MAG: hypothetical protein K2M73_11145 [Lachnospiraceae bacterium]|nr:hypothetical protein [Lachnospiraceae bacterium]
MATFTTAIKKIYSEGLSKHGFKKIKGKQPYFVRTIGDEIVHIITYRTCPTIIRGHKEFAIYGGIATVYRACINLEKAPRDNGGWLDKISDFYVKSNSSNIDKDLFHKITNLSYEEDDEEAMIESIKYSFEMTEKFIIPRLNEVVNIKECVDFFDKYNTPLLYIDEKDFGKGQNGYEYSEGLLNILIYTSSEYAEREINAHEKWNEILLHDMKIGINGFTMEEYEIDKEKRKQGIECQIKTFEKMVNDSKEHKKVMEEIKRCKIANIEILRNYGIDI